MKTLTRLAMLCFCAAGGLLFAVHLAAGSSDAPSRLAATSAPQTERQPQPAPSESTAEPIEQNTRRPAPRFEALRPRVADEFDPARRTASPPTATSPAAPPTATAGATAFTQMMLKVLEQTTQSNQMFQTQMLQLQTAQLQNAQIQNAQLRDAGAAGTSAGPNFGAAPGGAAVKTSPDADRGADAERPAAVEPLPDASGEPIAAPRAIVDEGDGRLTINSRDDDIRVLLEQLGEQAGLNLLASAGVKGTISVNLQNVGVDEALDAILKTAGLVSRRDGPFLYIGTTDDFAAMEKAQDRIGTRVYRPNYVAVKELSVLITPLLTPSSGKISVSTPAAVGIAVDNTTAGGDSLSQQDALIVQDYEQVLAQIDQIVRDLDRRPLQVAIEAMIISVTLNDSSAFGVDFQLLRDKEHIKFGINSPPTSLNNFQLDGGLKFAFLDSTLGAFLSALETVGDANVVASPKLLCLNKQKAEILIGQRLGYISTTVTQNFASQNVEFLDVGAQLRLRPYISSDGIIRLEVHPELSEGEVVVNGGFTLPRKTLTEVTTNVMCPDGQTVILGGLMRENLRSNSSQVPYLGSLPAVGPLFRRKTESVEKTEILVLLTPRIVYDDETAAEGEFYERESENLENAKFHRMTPLSRAHMSRDETDRGTVALRNGDRRAALRHARRAVDYDPLNRDAVRLLYSLGAQSGAAPQLQGLGVETVVEGEPPPPLPGVDGEIPEWMLNEIGREGGAAMPEHPREPGQAGPVLDLVRPEVIPDARPR